ncbi:hypothetical protein HDU89_003701 [Geranomyces variabilis]|nr:hypothetical protein HDU89_003701 [Geranomyces variabilis]
MMAAVLLTAAFMWTVSYVRTERSGWTSTDAARQNHSSSTDSIALEKFQPSVTELVSLVQQKDNEISSLRSELAGEDARRTASASCPKPHRPVIITTVIESEMEYLRELVGSLHRWYQEGRDPPVVVVYAFALPGKFYSEIRLWLNVEVFDAAKTLFLGPQDVMRASDISTFSGSYVRMRMLESQLQAYPAALLVRNTIRFEEVALESVGRALLNDGYVFGGSANGIGDALAVAFTYGLPAYDFHVRHVLRCLHQYQCPDTLRTRIDAGAKSYANVTALPALGLAEAAQGTFYCQVLLRTDLLYSAFAESAITNTPSDQNTGGKPLISIGMLTLTTHDIGQWEDSVPLTRFIPSIFETITDAEFEKYQYTVYIGFDEGDRFFDDKEILPKIQSHLSVLAGNKAIAFRYIRMPFSKGWVTFLWNALFALAMRDGADYFMQVNDDLALTSPEWSSKFIDILSAHSGVGVTGPYEASRKGGMVSQAFVGRTHYQIFGRLYPSNLKDYFSDDWLSEVYAPDYYYVSNVTMSHHTVPIRYTACGDDRPRFEVLLARGRALFNDWITDKPYDEMLPLPINAAIA